MPNAAGAESSRRWLLLAVALAFLPVYGLFTTSRIFFVRDLSFFFWSRHLWLRHTVFAGDVPWWDPHVAGGQSAIADALNQLVMPVTLAIRLLPSDVVSFNLWVALPLPVAAAGMFLFLRQRLSSPASALGASIFALAGPTISMLNTPNLSWSVALAPWVLWSIQKGSWLAVVFALQALCGEPVTWVATGLLAASLALTERGSFRLTPVASGFSRKVRTLAFLALGGLLASAQLLPTFLAGVRAHRAALATPDFWSLHPLSLWEAIAPNLFGNYYDAFLADLPWMGALNFGRDPFFYSFYVGPLVLLLAGIAVWSAPRQHMFWVVVAVVATVAALGGYSPVYPWIRTLFPPLMYFRFPVKYFAFAILAVAVLGAHGWERLHNRQYDAAMLWPAASLGMLGLFATLLALASPDAWLNATHSLALGTHLKDPAAGAAFLARSAPPLAARFCALLLAGCILGAAAARRPSLKWALFAAACTDLAITNTPLNITMDAAKLAPPSWYVESAGPQRLYVGGRFRGYMNGNDPDGVSTWQIPAEATAIEGRMELNAELPMAPSGWGVREALSYDLPYLWPAEYEGTLRRFEQADPPARAAFLRRSGVRRCVLPATESRTFDIVAEVPDWNMRVFECNPEATRVFLAGSAVTAPNPGDLEWQRDALFDPALADDLLRIDRLPQPAGVPGGPADPAVRIVHDGASTVVVEAALRTDGVLVLRDTFDPSWSATVDGLPAEIVRANGLHRAVALLPGRHVIRFSYRPRDFVVGLKISGTALGVLLVLQFWSSGVLRSSVRAFAFSRSGSSSGSRSGSGSGSGSRSGSRSGGSSGSRSGSGSGSSSGSRSGSSLGSGSGGAKTGA